MTAAAVSTARVRAGAFSWSSIAGRELSTEVLSDAPWSRVVACINIWNDANALRLTLPSWVNHVDAIIAVDGAYPTTGAAAPLSTDDSRELLRATGKCELIELGHRMQVEKRNAYLAACRPGDLIIVVDADEWVHNAAALRSAPELDVGWVRISSPIYAREYGQPRVFRWTPTLRYDGRHHWMYDGDRLLTTHQYGGAGFEHRVLPMLIENRRGLGHSTERANAKRVHMGAQAVVEAQLRAAEGTEKSDKTIGRREIMQIAMWTPYDAGIAVSRLHTAINRTTPHSSVLFKGTPGPYGAPGQYHPSRDAKPVATARRDADVLHLHVHMQHPSFRTRRIVLHHHGSALRANAKTLVNRARMSKMLQLVSTLELLQYGKQLHWLPNPMPVARYRRLRAQSFEQSRPQVLRVAHSPSRRQFKGTDSFLKVCDVLRSRGIPIEPVLIENKSHGDALRMKAECDVCFDSFWLGIQCSGLEAASMGMPVIAGDPHVADRYREIVGHVPYTYAESEQQLAEQLERLYGDPAYFAAEAARVSAYTLTWHDESAVALRYLDLLDDAFHWRTGWSRR